MTTVPGALFVLFLLAFNGHLVAKAWGRRPLKKEVAGVRPGHSEGGQP